MTRSEQLTALKSRRPIASPPSLGRAQVVASSVRRAWGLWVATALGLVAYGGIVRLDSTAGTLRDGFTSQTIGWYLLAFAGFLIALWWNERRRVPLVWLWAIPIAFRLVLLTTSPTLSDDVYRYLWDGNVTSAGINPYEYALDAPELDGVHVAARELANNPSLGTPYLPTAQAAFAGSFRLAPSSPLTLQIIMVGFDLAAAGIIVALLKMAVLPRRRVMLYLWNPLVVVEVAHGAHLDALMIFLALLAVYLSLLRPEPRWRWCAPVVLALATLTKPLPLLLLPVLWPRWRGRQRLVYAGTIAAVLIPFGWTAGWGLTGDSRTGVFGSARVYSGWAFNSGIYHWLEGWLDRIAVTSPSVVARLVVAASMAAVLAMVWARSRDLLAPRAALRLMSLPLMAYALLSPTVHPWYLLILVAFLPFVGSNGRVPRWILVAPWLYLSGAVAVSYLTYLDPLRHGEIELVRQVQWYPTLLLVAGVVVAVVYARRPKVPEGDAHPRSQKVAADARYSRRLHE